LAKRIKLAIPEITPEIKALLSSDKDVFNLILHPGSYNNGREWGEENFIKLLTILEYSKFRIFITGVAEEKLRFNRLMKIASPNVFNLIGKINLSDFLTFIGHSDGLLAASTGPLHIAGAMGINTLGLYPPIHGYNIKRWGVLGEKAHSVSLSSCIVDYECSNENCKCMSAITPESVKHHIMKWYEYRFKSPFDSH
jgi:ADP-heptose:LPS heptosyltransferase